MDMDLSPIQVRLRSTKSTHTDDNGNSDIDWLTKELCNVLKDHNNSKSCEIFIQLLLYAKVLSKSHNFGAKKHTKISRN